MISLYGVIQEENWFSANNCTYLGIFTHAHSWWWQSQFVGGRVVARVQTLTRHIREAAVIYGIAQLQW